MSAKLNTQDKRFGAHAEWKGRAVIWARRNGVDHVAAVAASLGRGIVSRLLCGGASTMWPTSTTWYSQRRRGQKMCRKCVAKLVAAGERGRLQP